MVTQSNIAITQLVQVGLAEKVAQELQSHTEVLRQAAQQTTPELLRLQENAVPTTEDSKKNSAVKTSDRQQRDRRRNPKRQQRAAAPAEDGETQDAPVSPGAWSGYIVNVKV